MIVHIGGLLQELQADVDAGDTLGLPVAHRHSAHGRQVIVHAGGLLQELQAGIDVGDTLGLLVEHRRHGLAEEWAACLGRDHQVVYTGLMQVTLD